MDLAVNQNFTLIDYIYIDFGDPIHQIILNYGEPE